MCKFNYLWTISPLGMMYGSAGAFLSPENLVGRSGAKFPPDAGAIAGLFFRTKKHLSPSAKTELKNNFYVAGPFWAELEQPESIYVPIPWNLVITPREQDQWKIKYEDNQPVWQRENENLEPECTWLPIDKWDDESPLAVKARNAKKSPWKFVPMLHPYMEKEQRTVKNKDGLFLENAVQVDSDICLVYLATHELDPGCYQFGGENHLVDINCFEFEGKFQELLEEPIQKACALITPGVWGSYRFSRRYPDNWEFDEPALMLTDKPVPYRYRNKGVLGRGRYAVPAGTVYVFNRAIDKTWWDWKKEWFPQKGFLKHLGCGLCLPVEIPGLDNESFK